jgi:hypothetical protein
VRLRYGLAELLLIQPGILAHRRAPAADAPLVREALEAAARDDEPDVSAWIEASDRRAAMDAISVYWRARRPEKLRAPAPLAYELPLLACDALLGALGNRVRGWRGVLTWAPPMAAASFAVYRLRDRLERRAAERIGLDPLSAPRLVPQGVALGIGFTLQWTLRPRSLPWTVLAAQSVIRRLDMRRSWLRAYADA